MIPETIVYVPRHHVCFGALTKNFMSFGAGLERLIILALSSNRFGRFYKFKYIYAARMFISEKN